MSDDVKCPTCAGPMTRRTSTKTGRPFWGCLRYPDCQGLIDIEEATTPTIGPECDPKYRADGALALAVAMVRNWHNIQSKGKTVAELAAETMDELIVELQK